MASLWLFSKTIDRVQIWFLLVASLPTVASYAILVMKHLATSSYIVTLQRGFEKRSSLHLDCPRSKDIVSTLTYTLTGHPFSKQKDIIWMHFIRAFLWITWKERNKRLFIDKGSSFDCLF